MKYFIIFVLIAVLLQDITARPSPWVVDMVLKNWKSEQSQSQQPPPIHVLPVSSIISQYLELQHLVPTNSVPQSSVPQSTVPQNSVPQSTVPQNSVPQSPVPQNSVPQSPVPQNSVLPHQVQTNSPQSLGYHEPSKTPSKIVNINGVIGSSGNNNGSQGQITIGSTAQQPKGGVDIQSDNLMSSNVNVGGLNGHSGDGNGSQHNNHIGIIFPNGNNA